MNRIFQQIIGAAILSAVATTARAQALQDGPYDPYCWSSATAGPSTDYAAYYLSNLIFGVTVGLGGTDAYGKQCIAPNGATMTLAGGFGFTYGPNGSIQAASNGTNPTTNLTLTWGMPFSVGSSCGFAEITSGTSPTTQTQTHFGSSFVSGYYGASDRYAYMQSTAGSVNAEVRVDMLGDAARFDWKLYNTTTSSTYIGMKVGSWPVYAQNTPGDSPINYIYSPGFKPFQLEQVFQRTDQVLGLPNTMIFGLSQSQAYGLEVLNAPETAPNTDGVNVPDQTPVDDLLLANTSNALTPGNTPWSAPNPPSYPNYLLFGTDFPISFTPGYGYEAGFLQVWHGSNVAANGYREIITYYRPSNFVSDYAAPFAAVIDAPKAISTVTSTPTQFQNQNFTIRVYLDNVRGYATVNQDITLTNTRVELDLPAGLANANSPTSPTARSIVSYINAVAPRTMGYVDFPITVLSNIEPGLQTYTVTINTTTGVQKVLTGTINVAATPSLQVLQDANLVAVPWLFSTQNWSQILADPAKSPEPQTDVNFQAFTWDAVNQQYVVQPNAVRGVGTFLVSTVNQGTVQLQGSPTQDPNTIPAAPGTTSSAINVTLQPGWNLIGNPYNYSFQLGQFVGADTGNNGQSGTQTFEQLVASGLVAGSLAYYDPTSQSYQYITNSTDLVQPNLGYWIYVTSPSPLLLNYPVILSPFVQAAKQTPFVQSATQWKLQIAARNSKRIDSQNFIGVASSSVAKTGAIVKPPIAPISDALSVAIRDTYNGKATNLAQSLRTGGTSQTWSVQVYSKSAGSVTLTWPNLSKLPSGVQLKLTDTVTGVTRDLRSTSGYTFNASQGGTRTFTIASVNGAASRAIIGSVLVSQASRAANSPYTISYTLMGSATTTVSVLQNGRVIYQPVLARSDPAGQSTAVWNLRDSANRAVAPGQYQIQILAEDSTGGRYRRVVPVTVTR